MTRFRFLRHGVAILTLAATLPLTACNDQSKTTESGTAPAPTSASSAAPGGESSSSAFDSPRKATGALSLHFIINNPSNFWTASEKGLDAAKEELKGEQVEAKRYTPAGAKPTNNDQKKTFEDALAANTDGIAVTPIEADAFAPVIDSAIGKGIPVICFDSDSEKSKRLTYLGTNNYEAGKAAGEAALKLFPNGGKFVAFSGNMSAQNSRDRYQGFIDATKGKIEMLQEPFTDGGDKGASKRNVADAITKYGDKINGFLGIYSYNGPTILSAVEDAKLLGKVKIVAFDGDPLTLKGLQDKKVDIAIVQKPYEFGRISIKLLTLINRKGYKAAIEELKPELEKAGMKVEGNKIDTGVNIITPENIAPFMENLKKLGLETT